MFLKQLKLAGFKSFVEPTVVPFPGSLVAVVGPNGCGKSNIIDAVKWVLGESSAKNLRGESMADVIFNGSTQRKALGQASVELVFDNRIRRLSGAFANFDEISVRRVVHRDGESQYFLNGSRCRKKDITDIFLGTGAGARGYSIIGQGTIARLIEARPEELRLYLEEAAGISKYKEKRKETLQRLERTKENLQRLHDIRMELQSQTERLAAQSESALRYQSLSAEEKALKKRIAYRKWSDAKREYDVLEAERDTLGLSYQEIEHRIEEEREQIQHLRQAWHTAQEEAHLVTAAFYEAQTSLSRVNALIEQTELHLARQHAEYTELQTRFAQALQESENLGLECAVATERLQQKHAMLEEQSAVLEAFRNQRDDCFARFEETKLALQDKQQSISQVEQQLAIAELKLGYSKTRIESEHKQQERILAELDTLAGAGTQNGLDAEESQKLAKMQMLLETRQRVFDEVKAEEQAAQLRLQTARQALKDEERLGYQVSVNLAKRKAELALRLQKDALQNTTQTVDLPCLAEALRVPEAWQKAVEAWLGDVMQARLLEQPEERDTLQAAVFALDAPSPYFIETYKSTPLDSTASPAKTISLLQCLKCSLPNDLVHWERVFLVEDVASAEALMQEQSVPCVCLMPDGSSLGFASFRKYHLSNVAEDSIFAVQSDVASLEQASAEASLRLAVCQNSLSEAEAALQRVEAMRYDAKHALEEVHRHYVELRSKQETLQAMQEQAQKRRQQLQAESQALTATIAQLVHDAEDFAHTLNVLQTEHSEQCQIRDALRDSHAMLQAEYDAVRACFEDAEHHFETSKRESEQFNETLKLGQTAKARLQGEIDSLTQRMQSLQTPSPHPDSDIAMLQQQQQSLMDLLAQKQEEIAISKAKVADVQSQIEMAEAQREDSAARQKQLEEQILNIKLKQQALWVKRENFEAELSALEVDMNTIEKQDDAAQSTKQLEAQVLWLVREIQALGPINLTAIAEYQAQSARLAELGSQCHDLESAVASLMDAIASIDKETISRFQESFDEINGRFQTLFPKLFGGGRAALMRSEGDVLDAGVVVMAQPPGKRNSTIHLLSGGEKAMTAVALVMAIFQCNPSPFCMLDEVDAPLDDANVKRFCRVIADMSDVVQFLFITHNKVTMELAQHLIGVTMREAGVSRIVAVDVEQALTMRETSE